MRPHAWRAYDRALVAMLVVGFLLYGIAACDQRRTDQRLERTDRQARLEVCRLRGALAIYYRGDPSAGPVLETLRAMRCDR